MSAPSVLFDDLGPRGKRLTQIATAVSIAVLGLLLYVAFRRLHERNQFAPVLGEPFTSWPVVEGLLKGLFKTLEAAALSMLIACVVGAFMALGRLAQNRPVRWIAGIYVEFFRAIPIFVLITFAFLGLPQYNIDLSAYWSLVVGLSLYNSAMLAEIFRAGVLSLDRGQGEAATALGMTYWQSMFQVIIPQAARRMVPGLISQLVALLKDTSLGAALTYVELLKTAQIDANYFGNLLQMLFVASVVYMTVNMVLSFAARRLEMRQRRRYKAAPLVVVGNADATAV